MKQVNLEDATKLLAICKTLQNIKKYKYMGYDMEEILLKYEIFYKEIKKVEELEEDEKNIKLF